MITLTPEQEDIVQFAVERLKKKEPLTTIGGYAGTGKTTIMGEIVKRLRAEKVHFAFACYTGKAKSVLESKLRASDALQMGDFCGTLHSLLYKPIQLKDKQKNPDGKEHIKISYSYSNQDNDDHNYSYVIIDEASMLDQFVFQDVQALGLPILAVGDHGQLPPVASRFNLMQDPMRRLETIHRQAENNPIIRLSMIARETGQIPIGEHGAAVIKTKDGTLINRLKDLENWMVICGTNKKRARLNGYVRDKKFGTAPEIPQPGEKVICLRNNHMRKIFNGMIGTIIKADLYKTHWFMTEINMGEFTYTGQIFRYQFNYQKTCNETMHQCHEVDPDDFQDLFDFGYCLTAHKAQGSESENVIVYEEQAMKHMQERMYGEEGWRRWLYTAITRAKNQLIIIGE